MPIGSIIGGLIGKGGADAAAGAYGQAEKNADFIRRQNQALESPWFSSGVDAQNQISGLLGLGHYVDDGQGYGGLRLNNTDWQGDQNNALAKFKVSPDYNFRMQEGVNALDRSGAAKGMLLSGAQTKGVQKFGGDLASGEYNNWFNKLAGVGTQGQGAAGTEVNSGLNTLAQQNQAVAGRAGAYQSSANALANGIMNGVKNGASLFGAFGGFGGSGGAGGMGAAGTSGSPYYGPVYSGL